MGAEADFCFTDTQTGRRLEFCHFKLPHVALTFEHILFLKIKLFICARLHVVSFVFLKGEFTKNLVFQICCLPLTQISREEIC